MRPAAWTRSCLGGKTVLLPCRSRCAVASSRWPALGRLLLPPYSSPCPLSRFYCTVPLGVPKCPLPPSARLAVLPLSVAVGSGSQRLIFQPVPTTMYQSVLTVHSCDNQIGQQQSPGDSHVTEQLPWLACHRCWCHTKPLPQLRNHRLRCQRLGLPLVRMGRAGDSLHVCLHRRGDSMRRVAVGHMGRAKRQQAMCAT